MANPADIPVMLHEMTVVGTAMSVATVAVWGAILVAARLIPKTMALREMKRMEKPLTGAH